MSFTLILIILVFKNTSGNKMNRAGDGISLANSSFHSLVAQSSSKDPKSGLHHVVDHLDSLENTVSSRTHPSCGSHRLHESSPPIDRDRRPQSSLPIGGENEGRAAISRLACRLPPASHFGALGHGVRKWRAGGTWRHGCGSKTPGLVQEAFGANSRGG